MRHAIALRKALRSSRGAAVVELAVLMMVFVPLTLLPLYFQDALRYRLDAQEAITQTTWDFAYQNYEHQTAQDVVKKVTEDFNQKINESLWSGDDPPMRSKSGPWAEFDWEKKIDCAVDKDFGDKGYMLLSKEYHKKYTKGGLVTCSGQISVTNTFLPSTFLQEFSHDDVDFFKPRKDKLTYPVYAAGLMVDSWSVNGCNDTGSQCPRDTGDTEQFNITEGLETGGNGGDAFYERTELMWKKPFTYYIFYAMYLKFIGQAVSDEIASPLVLVAAFIKKGILGLDNPLTLKMGVNHDNGDKFVIDVDAAYGPSDFYSLPYEDGDEDMPKKMLDNRKSTYMGCGVKPNC
ncbi:MAG TPA: hypothetical protein PK668_04585 [Myxococcota bacterium]|nr:hypothetical protein [Myxococcota bacterium]HRY92137.1 hypothetical protein [Myxococcota bacterium]